MRRSYNYNDDQSKLIKKQQKLLTFLNVLSTYNCYVRYSISLVRYFAFFVLTYFKRGKYQAFFHIFNALP